MKEYLHGKENFAIRIFFYLDNGVGILNQFRNLFLGIFALYFTLKLDNPLWLVLMFVIAIPILVIVGYYNVHRMAKVREWLSTKFSTHYGIKQFELIEEQTALLKEIKEKICQK